MKTKRKAVSGYGLTTKSNLKTVPTIISDNKPIKPNGSFVQGVEPHEQGTVLPSLIKKAVN